MQCSSCQADNDNSHKFCGQCGTPLPRPCGACGFENPPTGRFCGGCGTNLEGEAAATPAQKEQLQETASSGPERRHLTVMFCDLVGSTDLSVKFDPEDLRDIITSFQTCCEQVIRKHQGYVARYMGDGLLSYFGYPSASEYDAEYAVRAGLEIIEAVSKLDPGHGIRLQTRVGIASGNVIVGDVIGDGRGYREETVVGETPNLAARLQGLAPPDGLVTSSHTQRLVGGLFEYEDMGSHQLKGFDKPVPVFRISGESMVESRFEAARNSQDNGTTYGREGELGLLQRTWQQAKSGTGQLVLVSGEAGIGKSQLLENFRSELSKAKVDVLRMYGSPHALSTPLHPIINLLRRKAGIQHSQTPEEQLELLKAFALPRGFPDEELPLLASLVGISADAGYDLPPMPPPEQKFRTMHALTQMIARAANSTPVVVIMEDLHWLDASSLDFIEQLTFVIDRLPVLILATARPEFSAPWQSAAHAHSLIINRLTEVAARDIMSQVSGGKDLPEEISAHILSKAEGVPLYVQELTRAVLEGPYVEEQDDRFILTGNFHPEAIPETLQDSLMARLDRMAPVKEVAQIASVLGREFQLSVLLSITAQPENIVQDALTQLVDADIIVRRGMEPHVSYLFKHALLQDSAYNALLRSRRRQIHAQIAMSLKDNFPTHIEERPELLAHHYTGAEMCDAGFDAWHDASQYSLRKFAHREVCDNLQRGLEQCEKLEDRNARRHTEFEMRSLLGSALMVSKGPGDKEVGEAYGEAVNFAEQHPDLANTFPAQFGLCRFLWASGELNKAVDMARKLSGAASEKRDPGHYMATHVLLGISLWHAGHNDQALENLDRVCNCYQMQRDAGLFFTYMMDFGVFGNFYRSLALQSLGRTEEAIVAAQTSLDFARKLDNPHEIGFGLLANFIGATLRREWHQVLALTGECIEFSSAQGFPEFVALARACQGVAQVQLLDPTITSQAIESAIEDWKGTGFNAWLPWLYGLLAESALELGDYDCARKSLANAQIYMEHQNERQVESMLSGLEQKLTGNTSPA
ncbi:adenylate/guanylate cyclase domain-containing protein [Halioglobus maricola]|uniref:Adenylate/guanylate cyclase domain-containing protein n=1 Tax=Halioglobus maricola TaxID=2601894 RepID=A0A5P9NMZ3_9GAMM|nr:adenylate/guanylate cyclase domain-containing protein [Halioglobus maricola]QFU77157.1 adenylate/guanylate cyclase domain-containing protein [Halioglobus maricola]